MQPITAIKHLAKTAFWARPIWDGTYKVCLGKRAGIGVSLPKPWADLLASKLNAAITEVRLAIQQESAASPEAEQVSLLDEIHDSRPSN